MLTMLFNSFFLSLVKFKVILYTDSYVCLKPKSIYKKCNQHYESQENQTLNTNKYDETIDKIILLLKLSNTNPI